MHGGPSGFQNAGVTRALVVASGVLTVALGVRGRGLRLGLSHQDIFKQFRLWRIVSLEFAFSSTPELIFGLYLIYYFRLFERQIGSNRYSVFTLFSSATSLLFEVLALKFLKDPTTVLASGPYGLIFASFVPFYLDIPVSSRFHMLGINFTDKSYIYLAGLQLLFSSWKRSFVPGMCGVLAGVLYRMNAFNIRRVKDLKTGKTICKRHVAGGLYLFDVPSSVACAGMKLDPFELHCQLGHQSIQVLQKMYLSLDVPFNFYCESYRLSSITGLPIR